MDRGEREENGQKDDPEIRRLREKTAQGALDVLEPILSDPNVQRLIRRTMVREGLKMGLFMGLFIVGLMMLVSVAQTVYAIGWEGNLILSVILIVVGLIYLLRSLRD
jgi:hypothetical protein